MKDSHEGRPSSISPRRQIGDYFDHLFGWGDGTIRYAVGIDGHFNDQGSYTTEWREYSFDWPSQRQGLIAEAMADAVEHDVYCRITLRNDRHAGVQGNGLGSEYCWIDLDHTSDRTERLLWLLLSNGSFIVYSGQPGHCHPYIKLDGLYPCDVIEDLNQRLDHFLGGGGKWAENTVLRVPGTYNYKGRAEGGEPYPVTMEEMPVTGTAPWSPDALREVLGPPPFSLGSDRSPPGTSPRKPKGRKDPKRVASAIVPVDPEPRPPGLSDRVMALVHFTPENGPRGDHSRSGQLYRLVAALIEEGLTDGQVMGMALYSEPGQDKFPDDNDLMREIQRIINKVRPNHQHPRFTCAESACVVEIHPDTARKAEEIRQHFELHRRTSTTVVSESKVLDALLRRAILIGDLELDMSRRELCELAGLGSRNTVDRALEQLVEAGYVELVLLKNGKPARKGSGNPVTRAYRYRLIVPAVRVEPHPSTKSYTYTENKEMWTCGSTLTLDPGHDIWRFQGLATVRLTYRALRMGYVTAIEIGEHLSRHVRTINRHLDRLARYGLAEQKPDGTSWIALDRDPEGLAAELGTLGIGDEQAEHHAWETEKFKIHLELRAEDLKGGTDEYENGE